MYKNRQRRYNDSKQQGAAQTAGGWSLVLGDAPHPPKRGDGYGYIWRAYCLYHYANQLCISGSPDMQKEMTAQPQTDGHFFDVS